MTRDEAIKRFIILATAVLFLTSPMVCSAYYVIHLKNGGKFTTDSYWKKDNKTMFYHRGGILGIENDRVKEIIKVDVNHDRNFYTDDDKRTSEDNEINDIKIFSEEKANDNNINIDKAKVENSKELKSDVEIQQTDVEVYRNKKIELKRKLDESLERFRQASGNKDQEEKKKAMDEMTDISKQIFTLEAELKKKNNGVLPEWWEKL